MPQCGIGAESGQEWEVAPGRGIGCWRLALRGPLPVRSGLAGVVQEFGSSDSGFVKVAGAEGVRRRRGPGSGNRGRWEEEAGAGRRSEQDQRLGAHRAPGSGAQRSSSARSCGREALRRTAAC